MKDVTLEKSKVVKQKTFTISLIACAVISCLIGIGIGNNSDQVSQLQSQVNDLQSKNAQLSKYNVDWSSYAVTASDLAGKSKDYSNHADNRIGDLQKALDIADGNTYGTSDQVNYYIGLANQERDSEIYDWGQMQVDINYFQSVLNSSKGNTQTQ